MLAFVSWDSAAVVAVDGSSTVGGGVGGDWMLWCMVWVTPVTAICTADIRSRNKPPE